MSLTTKLRRWFERNYSLAAFISLLCWSSLCLYLLSSIVDPFLNPTMVQYFNLLQRAWENGEAAGESLDSIVIFGIKTIIGFIAAFGIILWSMLLAICMILLWLLREVKYLKRIHATSNPGRT
ncbi:MAG: hypothetical protein GY847_09480 [Proteobacteria bacterium]|nr:hypothetical protein [Pseudomonadota bacterium]